MNNKLFTRATALVLAGVVALSLSGCFGDNGKPTPTKTPVDNSNASELKDPYETGAEADNALAIFPEIKGKTEHFSTEEIRLATYSAWAYSQLAYNDTYLQTGEWVADGMEYTYIVDTYNKYLSEKMQGELEQRVTDYQGDQGKTNQSNLLGIILFTNLTGQDDLQAWAGCTASDLTSCLVEEQPLFDEWKYLEDDNGNLVISTSVTANVKYDYKGETGFVQYTYPVKFVMVSNPYHDDATNVPSFVIDGIQGEWKASYLTQLAK